MKTITLHPCQVLIPYANNPARTDTDNESLQALSRSIADRGILQMPCVRTRTPAKGTPQPYEVVYGARRIRAAGLAGMTKVEAQLLNTDDAGAAELRITENLQREDLPILEQTENIQKLISEHDCTHEEVALSLGLTMPQLHQRLTLTHLHPLWKTAAQPDGPLALIDLQRLVTIARFPEHAQEQYFKIVEQRRMLSELLSYTIKELKEEIEAFLTYSLPAPWGMDFEESGIKCSTCPKRAKNAPELFPELAGRSNDKDTCLDRSCYLKRQHNFLIRKSLQFAEKNEGRRALVWQPLEAELTAMLTKSNVPLAREYELRTSKKSEPRSLPIITRSGKVVWREYNSYSSSTTILSIREEWFLFKKEAKQAKAPTKDKPGSEKQNAPASNEPATTTGQRLFTKLCKMAEDVLVEHRDDVFKTTVQEIRELQTPEWMTAYLLTFGFDHHRNGGTIKDWTRLDRIVSSELVCDLKASEHGFNRYTNRMPSNLTENGKHRDRYTPAEILLIHWCNTMYARLGLGGGPASRILPCLYEHKRIHGYREVDIMELIHQELIAFTPPKAWLKKYDQPTIAKAIEYCFAHMEAWAKGEGKGDNTKTFGYDLPEDLTTIY